MEAIAYLNYGRWVADCPSSLCTNALQLDKGQADWVCRYPARTNGDLVVEWGGCQTAAPVVWPQDVAAIERVRNGKPEAELNWRPAEETDDVEEPA